LSSYFQKTFGPDYDAPPTFIEKCIGLLIVVSVIQVVLETEILFAEKYGAQLAFLELGLLVVFSFEYLLRLYYCSSNPLYAGLSGRLRYLITPYALVDFVAIMPSFLTFLGSDLMVLRAIRLIRLLRVARLVRDNVYLKAFCLSFLKARAPLIASLCVTLFILFSGAVLMYFAEAEAQPEAFGSIPRSLWWAMATLTTVGYGDVYPITPWGKILASMIAILGIGVVAMPAGVIAANFTKELENQ
jgi:voltage-gated potassium channel